MGGSLMFTHWGADNDLSCTGEVQPDGLIYFRVLNGEWEGRYDPATQRGWALMYPKSTFFMGDIICRGA